MAEHLGEADLRDFYARLAAAEAVHGELFWKLSMKVSPDEAPHRAAELAAAEARLLETLPIRAAIH